MTHSVLRTTFALSFCLLVPPLIARTAGDDTGEWRDRLVPLEDERVLMASAEEEGSLVVVLTIEDPQLIRQTAAQGLRMTFDARGSKPLGVQFPVGMLSGQPASGERPSRSDFAESLGTLYLFPEGKESNRLEVDVDNVIGLGAQALFEDERLEIEVRIPLKADESRPYAIDAEPGSEVTLELETPRMERPESASMRRPGRGGRGMGGPPRGSRGERPERPEPLDVRVEIRLEAS